MKKLYSIDATNHPTKFCAGMVFDENNTCIKAAPILKWTIGKTKSKCLDYFKKKGYKISFVSSFEE